MLKSCAVILLYLIFSGEAFTQEDSVMSQKEWELLRDNFAKDAILMLARIDTLNAEMDSLKNLKEYIDSFDCEAELYKIVGATKEQVSDFRTKFDITESRINNRSGSPDEAGANYFNEIKNSKIRCLPEFSTRFISMVSGLESWKNSFEVAVVIDTLYTVAEGDYLRKIALEKLGDEKYWEAIWEANKEKVYNADALKEKYKKRISNPDIIYPGQVLKIPRISP